MLVPARLPHRATSFGFVSSFMASKILKRSLRDYPASSRDQSNRSILRDAIPRMLIACAPRIPGVATRDFPGGSSMPLSSNLKISVVIRRKLAIVLPPAFASSIGSFFLQLAGASSPHAPSQPRTLTRREYCLRLAEMPSYLRSRFCGKRTLMKYSRPAVL